MQNEKIKTPNDGAISTFDVDSTTKIITIQQKFENMPVELTEQPRFFKVGADKVPLTKDWSNPSNQIMHHEINGIAGFDCSGHGLTDDYVFFDFDHILNVDGTFINETAEEFVAWCLDALGGYCELSVSRTGLHMFAIPSIDYAAFLPSMSGGRKATYYFTDERGKDCPKLEIFYRTKGRYCLLTGNLYECDPQTPIITGELADNAIKSILAKIDGQIESEKKSQKSDSPTLNLESEQTENFKQERPSSNETFTDADRAMAMIEKIDVSQLSDGEWLSFMTACKNLNISYSVVDAKCREDSERYNEQENLTRWQSVNDSSFGIETLHGLAKRFGYSEKDFQREWHRENFYSKWLVDNKISDVVKSNRKQNNDFTNSDTSILSVRVGQVNERTDIFMSTDTTITKATKMDLFTLKEAASYIGVNEKTLRRWNKQKIFEPYLIDHHGDFFYTREELEQLKSVYTKNRNKTYSNVRTMSAGQNVKDDSTKLDNEDKFALFGLPHTDLYNAKRLAMFHGEHIRFLTDSARWYIYKCNLNLWQDTGKENSAVLPFAIKLSDTILANVDATNDADEKLAKKWQSRKTFSNDIEILKGFEQIRITEQDLNTHKNLLNCKNGVVDLQTRKLYPHDSKLLMTQCINAEYRAGYRNERVDKFLSEILPDEETLQALLRFLGYALTGEINEEKALFIHGGGGNGKSVTTGTLLKLFGDYGCGLPIESILVQPRIIKDADAATPAFAKLQWRRLAISEEIPAGRKLDYSKFKILTGGDVLPIRKLHQEATEIKDPTHKMIFSGNHLPELDDTHDTGVLRRWIQIKFEQDFTHNPDTTLKKFLQTDDALSALLNILVENAVTWYKDGLIISEKMKRDRDAYFTEQDFLADFIITYCTRDADKSIPLKEFINKLKSVCSDETRGMSDRALSNMIDKIPFITKQRKTKGNILFGIGWSDDTLEFEGEIVSTEELPPI